MGGTGARRRNPGRREQRVRPSLTRSNREGLEEKALEDAVANARKRAKTLAEAAGVDLGAVTAITETLRRCTAERSGRLTHHPPPLQSRREQEIQASVTVTFAIE